MMRAYLEGIEREELSENLKKAIFKVTWLRFTAMLVPINVYDVYPCEGILGQ